MIVLLVSTPLDSVGLHQRIEATLTQLASSDEILA
jgi:hypothetical protein